MTKKFLRLFGALERPAAWFMCLAGFVSIWLVLFDIIRTGDFKYGTLLISLDLFVSGFSAAQDAEDEVESEAHKEKKR